MSHPPQTPRQRPDKSRCVQSVDDSPCRDGLTPARAVVTLVEAACLISSLTSPGGSNHQPGEKGIRGHEDNWGVRPTMEVLPLRGKVGAPSQGFPTSPSRKKASAKKNETFF